MIDSIRVPPLLSILLTALAPLWGCAASSNANVQQRVEIRRTEYGVPHILAEDERSLGLGLGYCQVEDYGMRVIRGLVEGRGESLEYFGVDRLDMSFRLKLRRRRAAAVYPQLDADVRAMMEGFAQGVNLYVALHPDGLPEWAAMEFDGIDVAARVYGAPSNGTVRAFLRRMGVAPVPEQAEPTQTETGSNAWALAPSRTRSGHAILMRNPHLSWTAGYYEAHLTIPGRLNFYGDVRIGGPLEMVAGFNEHLGWATTNNGPDLEEIYELQIDPDNEDHYLFDGESVSLQSEEVTVEYRDQDRLGSETREFWRTALGPVIHRTADKIYTIKSANDGEFRVSQQYLRMMQARDLEEWKEAVKMRAKPSSHLTYADREGNIFYFWNAQLPALPHLAQSDRAVPAAGSADVWTELVPFEDLPQLLNPQGGYLHNENDTFHFTNLFEPLRNDGFPPNLPAPRLRLRSQHSLELIHNDQKFGLEEVCDLKHSMGALLADRVKDDLVAAVRATDPRGEIAAAIDLLERWDNTVAADSRGSVLFDVWRERHASTPRTAQGGYATPWSSSQPATTPRGLGDLAKAARVFEFAVAETAGRYGSWDVAWGDVHRIRMGDVDLPIGGGSGAMGCFRVLNFARADDGKLVANGGDGWVLAVEFGDVPRAYSILAYGQSPDPDSPHHDDQAQMFAENKMKQVAFTEADIRARLLRSYHPGEERR
jgi:acyl-homoserine-lactone acylase